MSAIGRGVGCTDATQEMFLKIELSHAWSFCFKYLENLGGLVIALWNCLGLAAQFYLHGFRDDLL